MPMPCHAPKCCPACGQPLPFDLPEDVKLTPTQRRIFEIVKQAGSRGIACAQVADKLYSDRRDGGPDNAVGVVHTLVALLNMRLRMGRPRLRIEAGHGREGYVIRKVSDRQLTRNEVLEIRHKYKPGRYDQRRLAIEYGVTQPYISQIITRKVWANL